jgi:RHS repeat-associated protein
VPVDMLTASPTWAGTTTRVYDYESRITTITYPNSSTNTFTYNGLDTTVGKVDSGGTKTYKRDGVGVTAPVLSDGPASYTPGLSERRSGTSTFSHAGIKNQHEQTAANESSAATQTYDAFGNIVSSSGTWKGPFGYGGSFGYQTDGDSGLKLLGHRYYDSNTGRFLTRDVAKDGRNYYVYCENQAVVGCDPWGLWTFVFTGTKLKIYRDDGKLTTIIPGFSGKPGATKLDQAKMNFGPIPEGNYYINPNEDQFRSFNPISWLGVGYAFWDGAGWGDRRIPIHPAPGNRVKGRGGFFLHGGTMIGSAGCIDIGPNDIPVIDWIGKQKRNIKLVVDYVQWRGSVAGGPWSNIFPGL